MASTKTKEIGKSIESDLSKFTPSEYGLLGRYGVESKLAGVKSVASADWSGVDSKIGTLNELASAFMAQYAKGSDIANAQNAQAAAAFARNAARSQANFAQLQNQGEQLVQQSTSNTAQGTQANLQQGQRASTAAQQSEIQKIAADMQRTFANMEIARTKKQILNQATLADKQGIQAATALQNDVRNNKTAADLNIEAQDWSNTLNAIKLVGGVAQGALAVGAGMSEEEEKRNTDYVSGKGARPNGRQIQIPAAGASHAHVQ